jgi:hypothetical protein
MVRKPNHTHAMITEIAGTGLIIPKLVRLIVLTPVQFGTDMRFGAVEVEDVWADGVLAAELEARELARSQMGPEQALSVGLQASKHTTPSRR